jgi:5''-3'' exonuclease, N-terminal resolvase-like domain.
MGLREETFKLDNSPAPLVINDFMVTCWIVFNFVQGLQHLYSPELLEKITKAAWAIKLNRGPDMLPLHDYRVVVVSDKRFVDKGVYWRGVEVLKDERIEACWEEYAEKRGLDMNEMALGYKGNRRDKDDNFYQVHQIGWEYAQKYFPCFREPGYEADDWAGALYREVRDGTNKTLRNRQKLLYTIDRDWSGLVDESLDIWWANTRYPGPRERIQERLAGEDQSYSIQS